MTTTHLKHITVIEEDVTGLTRKFTIKSFSYPLGTIKWASQYFAYAFYPVNGTLVLACEIGEIHAFIDKLNKEHNSN